MTLHHPVNDQELYDETSRLLDLLSADGEVIGQKFDGLGCRIV